MIGFRTARAVIRNVMITVVGGKLAYLHTAHRLASTTNPIAISDYIIHV